MPDETPGQTPNPTDGQTPPAAPVTPAVPDTAHETSAIPDWVKDPQAAYAEIQKTRGEAAETRRRLKAIEDKQAEEADKALEDQKKFKELADKRAEELETLRETHRQSAIRNAVLLEATRLNIADPADAYQLADLSKAAIDDNDTITGVAEAVAALVAAKPYLVRTGAPTPTPAPSAPKLPATNPSSASTLTADGLRKMTREEIDRLPMSEIEEALKR
jgi:hypothetical protein